MFFGCLPCCGGGGGGCVKHLDNPTVPPLVATVEARLAIPSYQSTTQSGVGPRIEVQGVDTTTIATNTGSIHQINHISRNYDSIFNRYFIVETSFSFTLKSAAVLEDNSTSRSPATKAIVAVTVYSQVLSKSTVGYALMWDGSNFVRDPFWDSSSLVNPTNYYLCECTIKEDPCYPGPVSGPYHTFYISAKTAQGIGMPNSSSGPPQVRSAYLESGRVQFVDQFNSALPDGGFFAVGNRGNAVGSSLSWQLSTLHSLANTDTGVPLALGFGTFDVEVLDIRDSANRIASLTKIDDNQTTIIVNDWSPA